MALGGARRSSKYGDCRIGQSGDVVGWVQSEPDSMKPVVLSLLSCALLVAVVVADGGDQVGVVHVPVVVTTEPQEPSTPVPAFAQRFLKQKLQTVQRDAKTLGKPIGIAAGMHLGMNALDRYMGAGTGANRVRRAVAQGAAGLTLFSLRPTEFSAMLAYRAFRYLRRRLRKDDTTSPRP